MNRENELWSRWEKHYLNRGIDPGRICRDGILNVSEYGQVRPSVLFVLREVNDYPGGNLAELLKGGPRFQMWHTVARWAAGIQRSFPPFELINRFEILREALHRTAAINLKKTSGGNAADLAVINAYAYQDRHLLRKQIGDIHPDVIVACGTFEPLVWILELEVDPDRPHKVPVYCTSFSTWVVPWRHPGRADNRETYNALKVMLAGIPINTNL
jgi:hypothetical protein